ncbi:MAG TPA: thermonuclease family protein [Chroococcales cyanobacterium]
MTCRKLMVARWNKSLALPLATLLTLSLLLLAPQKASAQTYTAKVVAVKDGDSLTILRGQEKQKVIMYGIDCPEIGQDFGDQAKSFTDQCCYNKVVTIQEHGTDKLGRTVAEVILSDGADLNKELVKRGLAWWSDKFAPGDATLSKLQTDAKTQKLGLWSSDKPVPPWIFRNGDRDVKAVIKPKSE